MMTLLKVEDQFSNYCFSIQQKAMLAQVASHIFTQVPRMKDREEIY